MIPAAIYLIFSYFSITGLGIFFSRLIPVKNKSKEAPFTKAHFLVLGIIFSSFLVQCYHLFFKISFHFSLVIFGFGLLFFILNSKKEKFSLILLAIPLISIFLVGDVGLYDSGLYHLQNILWNFDAPLILGFTNLHERFGLSHNLFLFDAFFFPFKSTPEGFKLSNGIFLLMWFNFFLEEVPKYNSVIKKYSAVFCSLSILPLFYFLRIQGHSPGADFPINIYIFLVLFLLLKYFEKDSNSNKSLDMAFLVSSLAISFKLTFLPIYLLTFSLIGHQILKKRATNGTKLVFAFGLIYIFVWILRTFLMSGCFLFPIKQSCFPQFFDWATPISNVENTLNWIKSWARMPGVDWKIVLANWDWFGPWFNFFIKKNWVILLINIILLTYFCFTSIKKRQFDKVITPILLIIFSCIAFWFLGAPDTRFGLVFLFSLTVTLTSFLFINISAPLKKKNSIFFIPFYLTCAGIFFMSMIKFEASSPSSFGSIPNVGVDIWQIKSGIKFYKPKIGDQCWTSPLPCSPGANEHLGVSLENEIIKSFFIVN